MKSKANGEAGQQSIKDSVFRFVENDDSGTIDAREFAVLYEAIKKDLEEDLEKQAALEKEASSATRRFKMLLLFVAVLVSFLAASVAANFAVLFTFVDAAITTATTGSGMLEVKGSDTIIKTAIATQDVPLMAAPALDIDTLSEVKSLKVVYSSTLGERIEAQLTVVGVRKHNSTFVEFVTSVGGETVEALNGVASLVRYPTNANRLTTPMKHAICSANATCSAFRTRGIDVGAALDLARAELEKSGFQKAARRLSPTLNEVNCFWGWWTWSACGIFGGLLCPFGSVMNALAYFYTGYSWFATRHVVFFAHGWQSDASHMWMMYCTIGVMWCPILELNEFRHLVFVFPTSFINGYLEPSEPGAVGGWGLAWNHPLRDSLKFEMGTDELAALMCGNSNAFELEWCWGFGWLGLFGVDDSSEVMIIGFSNGAGLATFANWAYGTTITKGVAIDYHAFFDYDVWLPTVHAVSGAAGFNLKMYEACASWTFSTDGIWDYTGEMTFGSGAQTLNDNCDLALTTGGLSSGFDALCYKSYGGFGYGYLNYKEFSWSESAPGNRKLVWAVHGFNETNHCALNEMAAASSEHEVHMFVPYFVGIIHDVLEWVDAATYGSWTMGGSAGGPALPPYPPFPPSPSPPPFPPTSSWFLGIKPLKPILKPIPEKPVGFGWVYEPGKLTNWTPTAAATGAVAVGAVAVGGGKDEAMVMLQFMNGQTGGLQAVVKGDVPDPTRKFCVMVLHEMKVVGEICDSWRGLQEMGVKLERIEKMESTKKMARESRESLLGLNLLDDKGNLVSKTSIYLPGQELEHQACYVMYSGKGKIMQDGQCVPFECMKCQGRRRLEGLAVVEKSWNKVFKKSMSLGNKQASTLSPEELEDDTVDEIGGLKRKAFEKSKKFCVDKAKFEKADKRRRMQTESCDKCFSRQMPCEDPMCQECDYCGGGGDGKVPPPNKDGSGSGNGFAYGDGSGNGDGSGYAKEDFFEGCPFGLEEYYEMMRLPEKYRKQMEKEFDTSQCDFSREKEVRREIFQDMFFSEEDEYGQRESLVRQRDLNITLDADKYQSFRPEEVRSIFGNAGIGSTVNLVSFSVLPPRAVFDLDINKQDIVRESYYQALEERRMQIAQTHIYKPPAPPPAVTNVQLDEDLQKRLTDLGYSEQEIIARKDDGGSIPLCDSNQLPPNYTDTLATTFAPPSKEKLKESFELQFGKRKAFELFDRASSGIAYPPRECKSQNGCFSDSDLESQVEFMEQQDEELDALRNEADQNNAVLNSMNNLEHALKTISKQDGPLAATRLFGAGVACFSRTTTACRLLQPASAGDAFAACFGAGPDAVAERVSMDALVAGDTVLADGAALTRVVVNQHAGVEAAAPMLTLHFEGGSLSLTADHVLLLDGANSPARLAAAGSVLSSGRKVSAVTHGSQGVVNPITAAGTILAAGPSGDPVVAATANEWLADVLLSAYPKYTLSFTLAVLFPASAQAYYDAALEPFFSLAVPRLEHVKAVAPLPAVGVGLVLGDALLSAGLFAFCVGKLAVVAAIVAAVSFSRKA